MITSIHQPSFFPWLGLLDKIAKSNTFVFLNDVPANKASYQYRNIFYCAGDSKFLSLPVDYRLGMKINDLRFKNDIWRIDHLNKIKNYYAKAPFFDEIFPLVFDLYSNDVNLTPYEFIKSTMKLMLDLYGINVDLVESSTLSCSETKGDLVLEICRKTNTRTYLSGKGALNYMSSELLERFEFHGIGIEWQVFKHPIYNQVNNIQFVEGLAALDMLFFCGLDKAKSIFWSNVKSNQ